MMPNQPNGMEPNDQRNFIIAIILMVVLIFAYQVFYLEPAAKAANEAREQALAEQRAVAEVETETVETPERNVPEATSVNEALIRTARIPFNVQRVDGSLSLSGHLLDDLNLKDHYRTIAKIEELRLLRPKVVKDGETSGYSADWTWQVMNGEGRYFDIVQAGDTWQTTSERLAENGSLTLTYQRGGLAIERVVSVDENYMFTFADTLTNNTARTLTASPKGQVWRYGGWKAFLEITEPKSSRRMGIVHQGIIGSFDNALTWRNYQNLFKNKGIKKAEGNGFRSADEGGWLGLTDMYWMTALIPEQGRSFRAQVVRNDAADRLEMVVDGEDVILAPGESATITNQIFAGAKEYEVVNAYAADGVTRFGDSIDWGNILYYLTKGLFFVLDWLKGIIGSFGWAILALTLLVRVPLIPLYNQSYKSMAKMKKLAEPMKEITERFKADPQRRQQEVMKLYQREKANPLAGCIPILFTIPVFFALYKTLYVTIEMRHEQFMWLPDLSAPDTLIIGNLFGLVPWASAQQIHDMGIFSFVLGIGVLAILYAVSMAGIQALSPPPPDPTQRRIMMALPFVFMFVFAG
ncbi:MAG: membrane protein insertase YidC, partial [Pseudomonadota bacterium]